MSEDIVTRLLNIASLKGDIGGTVIPVACYEAADEIERLRDLVTSLEQEKNMWESHAQRSS